MNIPRRKELTGLMTDNLSVIVDKCEKLESFLFIRIDFPFHHNLKIKGSSSPTLHLITESNQTEQLNQLRYPILPQKFMAQEYSSPASSVPK